MSEKQETDGDTLLVVDDTTIYEIDLKCLQCLTEEEQAAYFGNLPNTHKEEGG